MTFTCMKYDPVIVNFDARVIPFPVKRAYPRYPEGRISLNATIVHECPEGKKVEPLARHHRLVL